MAGRLGNEGGGSGRPWLSQCKMWEHRGVSAVHSEFLAFKQAENDRTNEARPKRKADTSSASLRVEGSFQEAQAMGACRGLLAVPT